MRVADDTNESLSDAKYDKNEENHSLGQRLQKEVRNCYKSPLATPNVEAEVITPLPRISSKNHLKEKRTR